MADSPSMSDFCRNHLEHGFRSIKKRIQDFVPPDKSLILDCGCGTGLLSSLVPASRYVGVDISERCIVAAKMRCPERRFYKMDARKMYFDPQSFGYVFVVGLLHHLDDKDSSDAVSEIHRVLKPSGKLVVFEDISSKCQWNILGRAVHALDIGTHIRKPSGYQSLLEKSFEILSMEHLRSGVMDYSVFVCTPRRFLKTQESTNSEWRCESVPRTVRNAAPCLERRSAT